MVSKIPDHSSQLTLTGAQRKALEFLAVRQFATPAEIGQAMGGTRSGKAQGLGRMGGAMAHRLVKMNLAVDMSRLRGGFPAYAITYAGIKAINDA